MMGGQMKELEQDQQPRDRRRDDAKNKWRSLALALAVLCAAMVMLAEPKGRAPAGQDQSQGQANGGAGAAGLQDRLAAVKQSAAENQQKLHGYQWIETTVVNLKGNDKPGKQSQCKYGPDGKVQKTPLTPPGSAPPQQEAAAGGGRGGRLKEKVVEKKKEEIKDDAEDMKKTIALYVPPDPQKMQAAFQAKKVSFANGNLVFKDYALPGDEMSLSFDTAAKKISAINVKSYMDNPKDTLTLAVNFASLPDGTNYVKQTVLDAASKQLKVTTTNTDYKPVGQ
jgi:hypothetical protein